MATTAIDEVDVEVNPLEVHDVRKPVSRALGTTDFAMNYFELEPGDSFSGGLHAHHDWDALQSSAYCPECEAERVQDLDFVDERFELTCTECGTTQG